METNKKVLEALRMQPLSEEEKASRHILARLYGPIATTKEKTRNGRGYNAELWQRALADEVFREKVANKSLFLELGHPLDREETDMEKVCACIPELPKIVDGDLYAYVDILDTKNGRLLKTLCDYGFIPGISSRGSGDIMANDEVDPETFFLETWDIVQLPAVKKARLTMCESLIKNKKTLKVALVESLDQMDPEDKEEAAAALERLDIGFSREDEYPIEPDPELEVANLVEDTEEITAELEAGDAIPADSTKPAKVEPPVSNKTDIENKDSSKEAIDAKNELKEADEAEEIDEPVAEEEEEEVEADIDAEVEEPAEAEEADEEETEVTDSVTVEDFVENFKEYDGDLKLEFKPIEFEGQSLQVTEFVFDDEEEGKLVISFNYDLETSDNIEDAEEESDAEEVESPEEVAEPEADEADEEAIDDGDEEVIESLMDTVRQKDALEEKVLDLQNQKAVSDAEVGRLKEELEKYKTGFMRVSELASKSTKLQKEVKTLTEQLSAKESTIRDLTKKAQTQTRLTESAERTKVQVKDLQERLRTVLTEAETTEQSLKEQVDSSRASAQKNAKVANAYKQKYLSVVEHYIASKANMLGVTARDIKSRLNEGYTLEDVDRVCDTLLDAGRPAFGFTRGAHSTTTMKVNESFKRGSNDEDDLSDLLELAGLN